MATEGQEKGLPAKLGLSLLATIFALGSLEIAVRVHRGLATNATTPGQFESEPSAIDAQALLDELSDGAEITGDTFNIYYFGGSTMASRHFVSLIGEMLGSRVRGRPIRSIGVAADGEGLRYNDVRLQTILEERDRFHPDVCVIYSGHNEFLKFHNPQEEGVVFGRHYPGLVGRAASHSLLLRAVLDRSEGYRLEIDERHYFDEPLFEPDIYDAVVRAYQTRLEAMVDRLDDAGIPVVVSTVAGNYADWGPNRSFCHRGNGERTAFRKQMGEGAVHAARAEHDPAIGKFKRALEICPDFAEAHFRLGKSYESLGRYEAAWQAYRRAVDEDGMPLRATSAQNEFIRDLGRSGRAHIVDAVEALREETRDGLIGFDLMVDGHHPNEIGYGRIADGIATQIARVFDVPDDQRVRFDDEDLKEHFGWSEPRKAFRLHVGRGRWFSRLATWRYDPRNRLEWAEEDFNAARRIDASRFEPYLGLAVVHYLRKEPAKADNFLAAANQRDPRAVSDYVSRPWVASVIRRARQP